MISPAFHELGGYFPFTGVWSTFMYDVWFGPWMCVNARHPSPSGETTFQ